jgi:hypothetical protein
MRNTFLALLFAACAGPDETPTFGDGLTLEEGVGRVSGTFAVGTDVIRFEARQIEPGIVDAWAEIGGRTLTVISHPDRATADYDGFATDTGTTATALTAADRALLKQFTNEIGPRVGNVSFTPLDVLYRGANWWTQVPDDKIRLELLSDPNYGWTSLCSSVYQYVWGTHDCGYGGNWATTTTRMAQIAYRYNDVTTLYCVNNAWTSAQPANTHTADYLPKMTGACWGHCGAGCPADNCRQWNTQDCLNHDLCDTAHGIATGSCDNELAYASDDYTFAPYCNGTTMADQAYHAIAACP